MISAGSKLATPQTSHTQFHNKKSAVLSQSMTRITQIDHEWLNIPMKSISVLPLYFPTLNYRIIYINTCNACSTYCYRTCTEVIDNIIYIIAILGGQYGEIYRSRSTVSARPKGGRIPRSRTPYCPTVGIAIINLLYNFCIAIGTGNNERAIWENFVL